MSCADSNELSPIDFVQCLKQQRERYVSERNFSNIFEKLKAIAIQTNGSTTQFSISLEAHETNGDVMKFMKLLVKEFPECTLSISVCHSDYSLNTCTEKPHVFSTSEPVQQNLHRYGKTDYVSRVVVTLD